MTNSCGALELHLLLTHLGRAGRSAAVGEFQHDLGRPKIKKKQLKKAFKIFKRLVLTGKVNQRK